MYLPTGLLLCLDGRFLPSSSHRRVITDWLHVETCDSLVEGRQRMVTELIKRGHHREGDESDRRGQPNMLTTNPEEMLRNMIRDDFQLTLGCGGVGLR